MQVCDRRFCVDRKLRSDFTVARGYTTSGQGNPDESRAARPILKDYVLGKMLFAHPPPDVDVDDFNSENRDMERLRRMEKIKAKRAPVTRVGRNADTYIPTAPNEARPAAPSSALDRDFFGSMAARSVPNFKGLAAGPGGARIQMYPHQKQTGDDGLPLQGVKDLQVEGGKKHFKGTKRVKQRSGYGLD